MSETDNLATIEKYYNSIYNARIEIASLKKEKAEKKTRAWEMASGTAKEKEDYVRSFVSGYDQKIRNKEAEIEYNYNMVSLLSWIENNE